LETGEKAAEKEAVEQILPEKAVTPTHEAPSEVLDYTIRHASGKRLSEEEIFEAKHYARELKYPKGALVSPRQQRIICLSGDGQKYGVPEA
jgi:hypothetical protein